MRQYLLITIVFFVSINTMFSQSDTTLIHNHLQKITKTDGFRNYKNTPLLNQTADYIANHFRQFADTVYFQEFEVNGEIYKNVIASFGLKLDKTVVVGAHYDVYGEQEGADDNASGVVGLLELARLLNETTLNNRIDLVAYSLEEPPFFRTENMGSYIHAKSLKEENRNVFGMISVEMIGYFEDYKYSQTFPIDFLSNFYGKTGDFILLVNRFKKGKFARKFNRRYKRTKSINTKKLTAPIKIEGIDFSDHLNYWNFGYSALMITDTAFYRNHNYHETSDTMETLDLYRMSKVINGMFEALIKL